MKSALQSFPEKRHLQPHTVIFCLVFYMVFSLLPAAVFSQVVTIAAGPSAAAITPARDQFRAELGGGVVAGANGSFGGVRREINWDGVPDALSAPNNLPANFFNVNSPRGVVFSTPGTGFQVSANPAVAPPEFGTINPTYPTLFAPFSPLRLFTALNSNIMDVNFFVAGTATPALTRGFGVVFSDVDLSNSTSIQLFDRNNNSLGTFQVPSAPGNETFSFLGVSYPVPMIARVRITAGNAALGAGVIENLPSTDLVVMDDFIYGEPLATCTPPTFRNDLTIVLDASECGNDGLITIIPTSGTAPFQYSIDGGTTYVEGPSTGYSFQGLAAGTYRLRLKDAGGCESAVVTKEVRVLYPCTHCTPPTFRNDLTIVLDAFCGSPGLITIIPTSGTAPFQYSIDGGATYVEGPATGYSFQGLMPGTYTLRLKDATGCQSDPVQRMVKLVGPCEIRVPFVKGRDQQTAERATPLVVAYPNPSHGQFQVQLQRFASSAVHLQVLDSRGVVVEQKRVNAEQTRTVEMNLSNKAKGLYIIRVVSDKTVQTTKVIIQ
ncbi:T9SS type A sorting domain-containing protein [Flavisolibacter nicotianae]|uniref:T9SS type A sorting domain-containing protein n=1 Tax=Flavisolibacter nicotianae TaxID=2364882 RepID=UPI0013C4BE49|nr:T9SS type A sorting domain-containing protein [Flavisolibacter nicotianae]